MFLERVMEGVKERVTNSAREARQTVSPEAWEVTRGKLLEAFNALSQTILR